MVGQTDLQSLKLSSKSKQLRHRYLNIKRGTCSLDWAMDWPQITVGKLAHSGVELFGARCCSLASYEQIMVLAIDAIVLSHT